MRGLADSDGALRDRGGWRNRRQLHAMRGRRFFSGLGKRYRGELISLEWVRGLTNQATG